ncbi:hypothetical protein FHG87_021520 [Trinorchestia longiramus]|nr:hypothetical protein FHG87_021520 [Trinorchestia longiramus]
MTSKHRPNILEDVEKLLLMAFVISAGIGSFALAKTTVVNQRRENKKVRDRIRRAVEASEAETASTSKSTSN